jgi:hypothetical protein
MNEITIKAVISKEGKTVLHVQGVKGETCLSLTEAIENRLGKVEEREYTPERFNWLTAEQVSAQGVYVTRG